MTTDELYGKLSKVYNLPNLPDEATGIIGDLMLLVDEIEPQWIPVTERLPEEGRRVIVYDNERACIYIASYEADRYYSGSYWEDDEGLICDFEEISAWMPMPKPYKE